MNKNYTAPRADLMCFEPWENVALEELNRSSSGNISFSDLWMAANAQTGTGTDWKSGDISVPV